jgi:hypothetical protein
MAWRRAASRDLGEEPPPNRDVNLFRAGIADGRGGELAGVCSSGWSSTGSIESGKNLRDQLEGIRGKAGCRQCI